MLFTVSTLLLTGVIQSVFRLVAPESYDDQRFAYTQIISNCVGQQFVDQQTARLVEAVRRCEQISPQPLRDSALEATINQIQYSRANRGGGGGRVVYVPVAVNPSLGGIGGGLGSFPFNQGFGGRLNPALQGVSLNSNPDLFGNQLGGFNRLNLNQNRLNLLDGDFNNRRQSDSTFAGNNRGTGAFGIINTDRNSNSNARGSSNPFGFQFAPVVGKQTAEGLVDTTGEIHKDELPNEEGKAHVRTTRQTRRGDHLTRIETLNYLSNMTCVLREARMIDHNNLPNYQHFESEVRRVQVSRDLTNDFATGLQFCKELTQCMNVERLDHPLARELGQAVAYFRCIARTNTKACKKEDEKRSNGNARLTGAFNFIGGNGLDLLNSVSKLALADDVLGFDFF